MGREMDAKQGFVIMTLITLFFLSLPLAITSIVLSQTHTSACDIKDIMGLNVKQYLLGGGIASLIFVFLLSNICILYLCFDEEVYDFGFPFMMILTLDMLFGLAWFIVGGVILFRSNLECIREGSVPVIYALVLWILAAVSCLFSRFRL